MLRTDAQRSLLLAGLFVGLLIPAQSKAASGWHAIDAGAAESARLHDVAAVKTATAPLVVVGGQDGDRGVVYRFAGGSWTADTLPADTPAVTDVAVSAQGAYAVAGGSLLRLGDVASPAAGVWAAVPDAPPAISAISLAPDGASGLAGAGNGHVWSFTTQASPTFTPLNETGGQVLPPNGGITGLAATATSAGLAVAAGTAPSPRFFELSATSPATPQPTVETEGGPACADLRAVAAVDTTAVAVDGGCWWGLESGTWRRHAPFAQAETVLNDVSLHGSGAQSVTAIAGAAGGHGAVWRRTGTGEFAFDGAVTADALQAIAVLGADDIWAVGSAAVRHFEADPAPADTGSDGGTGGGGDSGASSTDQRPRSDPPRTPEGLQVIIDQPPGKKKKKKTAPEHSTSGPQQGGKKPENRHPGGPKRLMRHVSVRAVKHGLAIEFDLSAPAKVAVAATRGKHKIGSTKRRTLKPGHRRIVLRYSGGKPPTSLRITARRSTKTGASTPSAPGKP